MNNPVFSFDWWIFFGVIWLSHKKADSEAKHFLFEAKNTLPLIPCFVPEKAFPWLQNDFKSRNFQEISALIFFYLQNISSDNLI